MEVIQLVVYKDWGHLGINECMMFYVLDRNSKKILRLDLIVMSLKNCHL